MLNKHAKHVTNTTHQSRLFGTFNLSCIDNYNQNNVHILLTLTLTIVLQHVIIFFFFLKVALPILLILILLISDLSPFKCGKKCHFMKECHSKSFHTPILLKTRIKPNMRKSCPTLPYKTLNLRIRFSCQNSRTRLGLFLEKYVYFVRSLFTFS